MKPPDTVLQASKAKAEKLLHLSVISEITNLRDQGNDEYVERKWWTRRRGHTEVLQRNPQTLCSMPFKQN